MYAITTWLSKTLPVKYEEYLQTHSICLKSSSIQVKGIFQQSDLAEKKEEKKRMIARVL